MDFVHLHTHSHYSLLEGLPKIDDLVSAVKERGMTAIALTDYGSMYGAIEFYKAATKAGIKPIIGFEAYLAKGSRHDKPLPGQPSEVFHLVLLAENETGYRNLMKLTSLGHLEGFFEVPRIDKELLAQYHEGIIALSGCEQGEIAQLILKNNFKKAKAAAEEYAKIFSPGHFYLELQDHPDLEGQLEINNGLIRLSEETGLPLVVTRDVHYLSPDDREAQDVLTCIRLGEVLDNPDRSNRITADRSLNTGEDIASRFRHAPEAIKNTVKIAERCSLELKLGQWHFPPIEVPPGKTASEELCEEARVGLKKLAPEMTEEMEKRLNYELDIICKKGYAPYFLAVADYVRWARGHNIITTTRGSAAGSLVSYALGITEVNPLYFNLPFERFLNPYRPSPPDIDMDFADNRRDDVIKYVTEKYGKNRVAQVITFGTMMARGSVRDVGRALGYSYSFCDQIAKLIPFGSQGFPMTLKQALRDTPDLQKLYNENEKVKRLLDLAQKIEGCARHTSVHAAGVVIAPTDLTDFTPVQHETGGDQMVTQYEMNSVEDAGVLKMDFLGIRNLSILGDAIKIVEKTRGVKVNLQTIPWDDKKTFDMLARGETYGLFQLGGSGMTRYVEELKPTSIFDIMAMIALFRPGPMAIIPEYISRKHGKSRVKYYHPKMQSYLDKSFGLLVYQDDLLFTAMELAGYTWESVDKFRKAVGKKIPAEMAKQHDIFVAGCQKHSQMSQSEAEKIWELFEPFQGYGFNKAHAASYAVVAYQTAYMKAYFPEEYMAAVLSAEAGDIEETAKLVAECRKMDMEVLPPDVNESFELFAVAPNRPKPTIRFGLEAVKNVGAHIAEVIVHERKNNGPYKNLEDFLTRVRDKDLNKKSLESLIKCGAFDQFAERGLLLGNIELLVGYARDHQKELASNQSKLFDLSASGPGKLALKPQPAAGKVERLAWEKELIGLYISEHPFTDLEKYLGGDFPRISSLFAGQARTNQWVTVCGFVSSAKRILTKKGEHMLFVNLQDSTGQVEVVFFPRLYTQAKDLLEEGKTVCIIGKYSEREGEKKLIAEQVEALTAQNALEIKKRFGNNMVNAGETVVQRLLIPVRPDLNAETVEKLKEIFKKNPGQIRAVLAVGDKKIDTGFLINPTPEFKEEIKKII